MVENVSSLTRNGLRDWLVQRVTSVVVAAYVLFLTAYFILHSPLQYSDWHALFSNTCMRVFTFLALLSTVYHTWVGIWTVFTDYVKCIYLRSTLLALVIFALFAYLAWGVAIVWGVGA